MGIEWYGKGVLISIERVCECVSVWVCMWI